LEFWAVVLAIIIFVVLLDSGELPLALFAMLLVLGVADEKRLSALARNLGKIYYKVNKEISELLNINMKIDDIVNIKNVTTRGIGSIAEWREKRISIKARRNGADDLLRMLYEKYVGSEQRGRSL